LSPLDDANNRWGDIGYNSVDLGGVTPYLDTYASQGIKLTHVRARQR
jgi:hypothetical protein